MTLLGQLGFTSSLRRIFSAEAKCIYHLGACLSLKQVASIFTYRMETTSLVIVGKLYFKQFFSPYKAYSRHNLMMLNLTAPILNQTDIMRTFLYIASKKHFRRRSFLLVTEQNYSTAEGCTCFNRFKPLSRSSVKKCKEFENVPNLHFPRFTNAP